MKTITTFLSLIIFSIGVNAQYALPVDFEFDQEDTVWAQFANAGDDPLNLTIAENPDMTGINASDHCIKFVVLDGADQWAGAWSDAYGPITITAENALLQMMVYKDKISPSGLKLETGGPATELKVSNTVTGEWELLTFDFSAVIGNTFTRLVFFPDFPDEARTSGGTTYLDKIDFVPKYGLPVDFEIPKEDTAWIQFANAPDTSINFTVVANPDKTGINTSDHCNQFIVTDNADQWAGAFSDAYGAIEITAKNHKMQMMVYKDKISPCGLKLESGGPATELKVSNTVTGEWELLTFDFSAVIGNTFTRLVFFPDFPDEARTSGGTVLIDKIDLVTEYGLPVNWEIPQEDTAWIQFANAPDTSINFTVVSNPDKSGINTSDHCIKFVVTDAADQWAGAFADAYGPIKITADSAILQMMVYKDKISPCGLKLESGGPATELKVSNTVTGEWELLTFNFSAVIGNTFARLVFFPDFPDEARTAGGIVYIDNIDFGAASSVREVNGAYISVFPNPATEMLTVQYPAMRSITITNLSGQRIRLMQFQSTDHKVINISDLRSGLYFVTIESAHGNISTKFIKQ